MAYKSYKLVQKQRQTEKERYNLLCYRKYLIEFDILCYVNYLIQCSR